MSYCWKWQTKSSLCKRKNQTSLLFFGCSGSQLPVRLQTMFHLMSGSWVMSQGARLCLRLRRQTAAPQWVRPLCSCAHISTAHKLKHTRMHTHSYRVTPFLRNSQLSLAIKLICDCDLQSCRDGQQAHWRGAGSSQLSLGRCLFMDKQSAKESIQIKCYLNCII